MAEDSRKYRTKILKCERVFQWIYQMNFFVQEIENKECAFICFRAKAIRATGYVKF